MTPAQISYPHGSTARIVLVEQSNDVRVAVQLMAVGLSGLLQPANNNNNEENKIDHLVVQFPAVYNAP